MDNREQQDRGKALITEPKQINAAHDNVQVIEWEDFESEVARLWSLISALKEANEKKQSLEEKLQSLIQEANRLLTEERGYVKLKDVQRKLRARQQYMISQVSLLYPVKILVGPAQEQELESYSSSSRLGNSFASKPVNQGSLTILGLNLTMLPFTKISFFTDKKEVQKSASALGYVAHTVSLIASYLKVPLRYPLRLGGSRMRLQ